MTIKPTPRFAFTNPRVSLALLLTSAGIALALFGSGVLAAAEQPQTAQENSGIQFGQSYHNDVSPALRDLPAIWPPRPSKDTEDEAGREARMNPKLPLPLHVDEPDPVVDHPTTPVVDVSLSWYCGAPPQRWEF